MVLYAREDIQRVSGYTEGHVHERPIKANGKPVPVWGIDCPSCESALGADPSWAKNRFNIPRSPDQEEEDKLALERAEAAERQASIMLARERMAAMQTAALPEPILDPDDVAITKDVGGTGSPRTAGAAPPREVLVERAKSNYGAMTRVELVDLARERGLTVSGSKDVLIARHAEHHVDNQ